ncbi:MAG: Gfo/Idh/MocA family protein [Tepidisphaerales bacterium]
MAETRRRLRLIQAGVGGMGRTWWKGATQHSPDFEVVALVDIAEAPLAEAGDALGVPAERRFTSLADALERVEADAVLTVTPPPVHAEHAELAFARGLHLLTEKPIADTMENAVRMVELARRAGRQLVVAQNYRFSPSARRFRELVRASPVGAVGHGHLDFYIPGDFGGTFRGTMEFPLLVDMAIHHFDLIRCVTGLNIRDITAMSFRPRWSWYRHDPGLKMLMTLDDGSDAGIPFSYSGDWSAFGKTTSWNGTWRLQCDQGTLTWEDDKLAVHRSEYWGNHRCTETVDIPAVPLQGQAKLLADFAQAIRTGVPAETSGEDNLQSFGAVMAAVRSAREGRKVALSEVVGARSATA